MDLPNLEELHFSIYEEWEAFIRDLMDSSQVLTHTLIEAIFKSSFFSQLKVLNLKKTNIDDRSLAFLDKLNLTTNISGLNLCNISLIQRNASSAQRDISPYPIFTLTT
jgi:hypothetical protein